MRSGAAFGYFPGGSLSWSLPWLAILAMALVLRLLSADGDLWLDEVVSLNLANHFSVFEILSDPAARHDNNHVLYTIYLRSIEGARSEWVYRALAIGGGLVGVGLMGWIGCRRSRRAGLLAAFLGSFAYILVHYGSEARGYSLASAIGLGAWLVVERDLARPRWTGRAGLVGLVTLGYLAHYSFGFVYAGLLTWMGFYALRGEDPWQTRLRNFLGQNLGPILITIAIYWLHVRPMHLAGGPEFGVGWALWSGLGEILGFQFHRESALVSRMAPIVALLLLLVECGLRVREGEKGVTFYAGLFGVAALGTLFVIRPNFVVPRYFFVAIPFALILVGSLLDRCLGAGGMGRGVAALLVAYMIAGSAPRDLSLIQGGRGHYRDAVNFMADHGGPVVRVSGTDPRWVRVLIDGYYAQFRPDVRFEVRELGARADGAPVEWYLHNTWAREYPAPEFIEPGEAAGRFRFVRHYPFSGLSGWHWYLYRRQH